MDVKVGSGAFMPTHQQATQLAKSIVDVATAAGLPTAALLTEMDQPLGLAVGNAVEVNEAVGVLRGGGPSDVRDLVIETAAMLMAQVGVSVDLDAAKFSVAALIDGGRAMEVFLRMVAAQGGKTLCFESPAGVTGRQSGLPLAPTTPILARRSGYVSAIDCQAIGRVVQELGGGRRLASDCIDPSVGVVLRCKVGDEVAAGEPLLWVHAHEIGSFDYLGGLVQAVSIRPEPVAAKPLILSRYPFPD